MIRYVVKASALAIMTREDSSWSCYFNLTSKRTACHMNFYLTSFFKYCQLYCGQSSTLSKTETALLLEATYIKKVKDKNIKFCMVAISLR